MKYVVRFLAMLGVLTLIGIVSGVSSVYYALQQTPKAPEKIILQLDFTHGIGDGFASMPLPLPMGAASHTLALHEAVRGLIRAKDDPRVIGVIGLFGGAMPSLTDAQEIRAALKEFRQSGKFSFAFAPSYGEFGPGNRSYYLASAFEEVWVQPVGNVGLTGLRLELPFAKAALEKLGIEARFIQREEYKNAMDFLTRDASSDAGRAMMQGLVDDLTQQLAGDIALDRALTPAQVVALMRGGPYGATEALAGKLVDRVGYLDDLTKQLTAKYGAEAKEVAPDDYLAILAAERDAMDDAPDLPVVAMIHASGEIALSASRYSPLSNGMTMDAQSVADAIRDAAKDEEVKIIILRVNSPGGSPAASETVRRAIVWARDQGKKVVVSMGEVAASGGYWMVMNADRIVANPATMTGSIGVIGGKLVTGGLWDKLGVNWESVGTGGLNGAWSSLRDYTPEERARVETLLDETYQTFRQLVSAARKISPENLDAVTKGRVFTGAQAAQLKLVDHLGGLDLAIRIAKNEIGVKPEELVLLKRFPEPKPPLERLREMLRLYGQGATLLQDFGGLASGMTTPIFVGALAPPLRVAE